MLVYSVVRNLRIFQKRRLHLPRGYYVQRQTEDVAKKYDYSLKRLVELCSAGRFFHHPKDFFKKFLGNRLFDHVAIVLLTERESSTYSPAERG